MIDFGFSELAASELLLRNDLAELVASSSLKVGPERAVAAARAAVAADDLADAADRLRLWALSGATRTGLKQSPGLLDDLRARLQAAPPSLIEGFEQRADPLEPVGQDSRQRFAGPVGRGHGQRLAPVLPVQSWGWRKTVYAEPGAELAELGDEIRRRPLIVQDLTTEDGVGKGPVPIRVFPDAAADLQLSATTRPCSLGVNGLYCAMTMASGGGSKPRAISSPPTTKMRPSSASTGTVRHGPKVDASFDAASTASPRSPRSTNTPEPTAPQSHASVQSTT